MPRPQTNQTISTTLDIKPVFSKHVKGRLDFLIERYISGINQHSLPGLPQAFVTIQLGGKPIFESKHNPDKMFSYPSVTTITPANEQTLWLASGVFDIANIYFYGDAEKRVTAALNGERIPQSYPDPILESVGKALIMSASNEQDTDEKYIDTLAEMFLTQLCKRISEKNSQKSLTMSTYELYRVQDSIRYIQQNITADLSIESMSQRVGLKQSHYRQLFKDVVGTSIHQYIIKVRLEKTVNLLRSKRMDLRQIAEECGYSSQSHMSACFKKHIKMTPKQYIKNIN